MFLTKSKSVLYTALTIASLSFTLGSCGEEAAENAATPTEQAAPAEATAPSTSTAAPEAQPAEAAGLMDSANTKPTEPTKKP